MKNKDNQWLDDWRPIFVNRVIPKEFIAHIDTLVREARMDTLKSLVTDISISIASGGEYIDGASSKQIADRLAELQKESE